MQKGMESFSKHKHFWTQAVFSAVGVTFSAAMLITGKDPSVYLPIFTSILFAWLPSPMSSTNNADFKKNDLVEIVGATAPSITTARSRRQVVAADNASNV